MKVAVVLGPTAVGKTDLTLRLAEDQGAEIVNADSVQVYRGLDIGSAKPTPAQQRRVPHHLLDIADPDQPLSVAVYGHLAAAALRELERRRARVILTGGSALYLDVALGRRPVPDVAPDPAWRAQAERLSAAELTAMLEALDPERARTIDRQNPRRLVRAIEIARAGRIAATPLPLPPLQVLTIGLWRPEQELRERIAVRAEALFSGGIVRETLDLWRRGFGPELRPMQSLGYREATWQLLGKATLREAVHALDVATVRFARRQRTWWRRDASIAWHRAGEEEAAVAARLEAFWKEPDPVAGEGPSGSEGLS